jgi:hypothetical protein
MSVKQRKNEQRRSGNRIYRYICTCSRRAIEIDIGDGRQSASSLLATPRKSTQFQNTRHTSLARSIAGIDRSRPSESRGCVVPRYSQPSRMMKSLLEEVAGRLGRLSTRWAIGRSSPAPSPVNARIGGVNPPALAERRWMDLMATACAYSSWACPRAGLVSHREFCPGADVAYACKENNPRQEGVRGQRHQRYRQRWRQGWCCFLSRSSSSSNLDSSWRASSRNSLQGNERRFGGGRRKWRLALVGIIFCLGYVEQLGRPARR